MARTGISRLAALAPCLALAFVGSAVGKQQRAHWARAQFEQQHPCPSTGKSRGSCPGWIIDHVQALCVGGRDEPANMQWQTVEAAKAKDRWECKPGWQQRLRDAMSITNGSAAQADSASQR